MQSVLVASFLVLAVALLGLAALSFRLWTMVRLREQALTAAQAQTQGVSAQLEETRRRLDAAETMVEAARSAREAADKAAALAQQESVALQARLQDRDAAFRQAALAAQAAAVQSATALSDKLLADHKRENEAVRVETVRQTREATEALFQRFQAVTQSVATLESDVKASAKTLDVLHRALSAPMSAGRAVETVLDNTLRAFGLQEGRDYRAQPQMERNGASLRPDVILFLPGDALLVIDAKASKALLDLAEAESDGGSATEAGAAFVVAMNRHLRDLTSRDYTAAVRASFQQAGGSAEGLWQVTTFMFLPNDGAAQRLLAADREFAARAAAARILIGGPSALWAAVGVAQMRIQAARRVENQARIVKASEALLESVARTLECGLRVGRGLKTAVKAYDDFARSANARLTPRARQLVTLGAHEPSRGLGVDLPRLFLAEETIDAEAAPQEQDWESAPDVQ